MARHSDPEHPWRILFQIALSHGEWVRTQRIAYKGLLTFLRSANLLNSQNGVSLLLVEQLWWKHRVMLPPPAITTPNLPTDTNGAKTITQENYLKSREEVYSHGLVNFEGFTDIMNVISVRCYQTRKCAHLHKEVGESLQDAIILSSEDNVELRECVAYTAKRCLKFFMYRNLVHRNTKMLLDPTENEWTIQTNRLVHHIVNSLQDTVVVPLFEYYSDTLGEMNSAQYERFIKYVFPEFTVFQQASAFSIFYFDVDRKERYGWVENLGADDNDAPLVFGLDSFVDALLMLSVVAFADESRFPHHLSITSKVWSVFECYLCPAMSRLDASRQLQSVNASNMAADPLFLDTTTSAAPYVSCIFPMSILVDDLSSILVGGINITIDPSYIVPEGWQHTGAEPLAKETDKKGPFCKHTFRRAVHLVKPPVTMPSNEKELTLSGSQDEMQGKTEAAMGKKLKNSNGSLQLPELDSFTARTGSPLIRTKVAAGTSCSRKGGPKRSLGNKNSKDSAEGYTAALFSPINCQTHISKSYFPYIDDEPSLCVQYARNRVEVLLPESVRNIRLFELAVAYKKEDEANENAKKNAAASLCQNRGDYFHFTPIRPVSFSLRDNTGGRILTSKTVVLKAASTRRLVPSSVLHTLQEAFHQRAQPNDVGVGALPEGEPCITMKDFENICCDLCLTSDASLVAEQCQAAVRASTRTSFLSSGKQPDSFDEDPVQRITQSDWDAVRLGFSEFMEAMATLGLHTQSSISTDSASDLINFLLLVLPISDPLAGGGRAASSRADSTAFSEFALPSIESEIKKPGSSVLPYNSRLNGPCKGVLHHCRHPSFASRLGEMQQTLKRFPKVLLPGYPDDVLGKESHSVSRRLDPDLHTASEILKNEFLMGEVTIATDGSAHIF